MGRDVLERDLALAEKHVARTSAHVQQQREIVARLELNSRDSTLSRRILATYEQMLQSHIRDRERLIMLLGTLPTRLG